MPGLLGYLQGEPLSADPERASAADGALWALGAGLIGGRGAAGPIIGNAVQGAMGTYQGLLADALKRRLVESQIAENAGQAQLRQQQLAQSQRQLEMQDQFLRSLGMGAGSAPAATIPGGFDMRAPGAAGQTFMPAPAAAAAPTGADRFQGVPNAAAGADIVFNGGKGLGGMIAKGAEPKIAWQSGVPIDEHTGKVAAGFPIVPQVERNGMGYALSPNAQGGFSVNAPPGAAETFGRYKDIENRSAAGMETVEVQLPGGRTVRMTKAQLADLAGNGPSAGNAGAGGPISGPAGPGAAPGTFGTPANVLDGLRRTESGGDPYAINRQTQAMGPYQFLPSTVAMLHRQGIRFDPFDEASARGAADQYLQMLLKQHGGDMNRALAAYGGFVTKDPSAYVASVTGQRPAAAGQPSVGPGLEVQSPAAAERAKVTATGQANRFVDLEKSIAAGGMQATTMLSQIQRARQLFEGLDGGRFTPMAAEVASAASSLGMKIDPKWDNAQAAAALTERMAMGFRPANSGAVSDADLASFQKQVPTLSKTPGGRAQILQTLQAFAQRDQRVAEMARQYRAMPGKGALDDEWEQRLADWTARNPIQF